MTDVNEVAEDVGVDIRAVAITDIEANDYNPNEVEAALFETLVDGVRAEGMNQPVLVRPHPDKEGKFLVVDGENRWRAATIAGLSKIAVVVVNYDDTQAKVRTLSYNAIRGQNVPIKLARLLVDLGKTYTDTQIAAMTGVKTDEQHDVLKLLEIPDFKPDDGIRITAETVDRPIPVNLMLMPDEHAHYTAAMKKALKLGGDSVTALIGNEVEDYNKAMASGMGLLGMKLRNVALATICKAFLEMPDETKNRVVKNIQAAMLDKRASDGEAKADKAAKTDKKLPASMTSTKAAVAAPLPGTPPKPLPRVRTRSTT